MNHVVTKTKEWLRYDIFYGEIFPRTTLLYVKTEMAKVAVTPYWSGVT